MFNIFERKDQFIYSRSVLQPEVNNASKAIFIPPKAYEISKEERKLMITI